MSTTGLSFNKNLNKISVDELSTELLDLILGGGDHQNDKIIHITDAERTAWNNKISKDDESALATESANGLMSSADKQKLNKLTLDGNVAYSLPVANNVLLGGILSGGDIEVSNTGLVTVKKAEALKNATNITLTEGVKSEPISFDGFTDVEIKVKEIDPSYIGSGYTTSSFYIDTHPDGNSAIIPFIYNDIAFFTKSGGDVIVKYDNIAQDSVDLSDCFDGSTSYWAQNVSAIGNISIELALHKTFTNKNTVYIDFGQEQWRCKSILIDVMNSKTDSTWSSVKAVSDNTYGEYYSDIDSSTFDKIRFTFSDWNSTEFRIAQIGLIGWDSIGMRRTYMSRGIDDHVYRNITPGTTNAYDLGSESLKWKNVYGNLKGTFNDKSFSDFTLNDDLTNTLSNYTTTTSLNNTLKDYATKESLEDYVTTSSLNDSLDDYATKESLEDYTTTTSLSTILQGYATTGQLTTVDDKFKNYTTTTDLQNTYATREQLKEIAESTGNIVVDAVMDANSPNPVQNMVIVTELTKYVTSKSLSSSLADYAKTSQLSNKVDKDGTKVLSDNNYTTTEKNKLAGIADGANKTIVDTALSSTSTNPVQNMVINERINAVDAKFANGWISFTDANGEATDIPYFHYYIDDGTTE